MLVMMGSIAGFLAKPAEGFYSATKHALEAYADVLRMEWLPSASASRSSSPDS